MSKFNAFLFLCIITYINPLLSQAQTAQSNFTLPKSDKVQSAIHLNQLVITGTRTERSVIDAPIKTEVIDAQTIEQNHHSSLDEAISHIPGIHLQGNMGRTGISAVIQGLGENHVLILLDSTPLLQKSSGGYDLSQISVEDIERVEVVKGASSSLYGSQAMGGVINIITKKIKKQEYAVELKSGATQTTEGGSGSASRHVLNARYANRKLGIGHKISIHKSHKNALDFDTSSLAEDAPEVDQVSSSVTLDKKLSSHTELFTTVAWNQEKTKSKSAKVVPGQKPFLNESRSHAISNKVIIGSETKSTDNSRTKGTLSYETISDFIELEDNPTTPFVEAQSKSKFTNLRTELQYDRQLGTQQVLTTGFLYQSTYLDQNNTKRSSTTTSSSLAEVEGKSHSSIEAFAQDDIIFNSFEITPGARIQHNPEFGSHVSPKISLLVPTKTFGQIKTNIRASIGTGYRVPSLKERYYILDHRRVGNYIVTGNPSLSPEKSVSYQLGAEWIPNNRFNFHLNAFNNDVTDLIEVQEASSNSTLRELKYTNFSNVQSYGVELSSDYRYSALLKTKAGFTFSKTIDQNTGLQIISRPNTLLKLSASFTPLRRWSFNWLYKYRSDEFTNKENTAISPRYTTNDISINFDWSQNTSIYFGVDNINDEKREALQDILDLTVDNRPVRGRYVYLGWRIQG